MDPLMLHISLILLPLIYGVFLVSGQQGETDALLCYSCQYTDFETDNNALKLIEKELQALSSKPCQFTYEAESRDSVRKVGCGYAPSGHINKCQKTEGHIEAQFLGNTFKFNIIKRGCAQVTTDYKDGCYDQAPETTVRQLTDVVQNLNIKSQTGRVCYSRWDLTNAAPAITISIATLVMSLAAMVINNILL